MFFLVKYRQQPNGFYGQAGFFPNFFFGYFERRIAYIGPATRKRPQAGLGFEDEEDFLLLEDDGADIDFRRVIAEVVRPFEIRGIIGKLEKLARHFSEADETLAIIRVFAISDARLANGGQFTREFQKIAHAEIIRITDLWSTLLRLRYRPKVGLP